MFVVLVVVGIALAESNAHDSRSGAAPGCPAGIARRLPGSGDAKLVAAYRTKNKRIVICRAGSGGLFYHGEYVDRPGRALLMRASRTRNGFVARNGTYQYEIRGGEVIVTHDGHQIGRERLTRQPPPS